MTEEQILARKILLKKQLVALVQKEIRQMQKTLSKKRTESKKGVPVAWVRLRGPCLEPYFLIDKEVS